MTCDNTGPFYLGISRESCENAKGRWTRGPCKELKACVSDYPKKGDLGYSQAFDAYVKHRLSISDANDQKQCNDTRSALGFSQGYPFDNEVCDAFYKVSYFTKLKNFFASILMTISLTTSPYLYSIATL